MKVEEYIECELCSILRLKPVAKVIVIGFLGTYFMQMSVKFSLFILIESYSLNVTFQSKIEGSQKKALHILHRANNRLLKIFS